jgi:predicted DNA-binding ArsR family transcriptional regulator
MSILNVYKELHALIHSDDELEDYDAPVKILMDDGRELFVNGSQLETNSDTGEQVLWLKAVEE